ncbi:MAG: ATP-binding cassette domain-containing protein [Actinophytocola sp.]|nr:ATP-binding cassette domain-containing protein [Actinophytocola sp.]
MTEPLLSVRDLVVEFGAGQDTVRAVDGIDLDVYPGETVGIVGESGSGKTVAMLAVMGLLPHSARLVSGTALLDGKDLLTLRRRALRRIRGKRVGMVFQDPLTSLHLSYRVLDQVAEAIRVHQPGLSAADADQRALDVLDLVGVPEPRRRARQYPHQWSGGMRQRAVIAMAIANQPALLIADEPTTALDVTVQAQILDVLRDARELTGAACVLITHDLGVVAELADRVTVMYAGRVQETGTAEQVFRAPRHPYTAGLLATLPRLEGPVLPLTPIPGQPPGPGERIAGCPCRSRCAVGRDRAECASTRPELRVLDGTGRRVACHFPHDADGGAS